MKLTLLVNNEIKAAMLAKEKERLEALRAAKSAFTLALTSKGTGSELTDEEEITIVKKLVKQRLDAAEIYLQQNRSDLAEPEQNQAAILKSYLPEEMSTAQLMEVVKSIIAQCGATSVKEMGKVMGIASKQLQGKADNKAISEMIKNLLAQ